MLIRKFFGILLCVLCTHANALTVPFQNIEVASGASITANYEFGPFVMIFCYANQSQNVGTTGTIAWTQNGNFVYGTIPITLVTNSNFTGQPADPAGTIIIQNTLPTTSILNCEFAF